VSKKPVSSLFQVPPAQWGLRGDPFLWEEMVSTIGALPLPENDVEFASLFSETFEHIVGHSLTFQANVFVERFAHGGMSSGYVSLEFWREEAFPLLMRRYLGA